MDLCVFSKHLQAYDYRQLGEGLMSVGVGAVDLTVRPGGHVEPDKVRQQLPEAVATLADVGVKVAMITTGITNIDDPSARDVLETAAAEGIGFYKLGYDIYQGFGTWQALHDSVRARLAALAALNTELGITAGFHNHSGPYAGANPAHAFDLIADLPAEAICLYFDIAHATIEGVSLGWMQALDQVRGRVRMLAFKDLAIDETHGERTQCLPVGEGLVEWDKAMPLLKTLSGQLGPVSIHAEYEVPAEEVLAQVKRDREFLEKHWDGPL